MAQLTKRLGELLRGVQRSVEAGGLAPLEQAAVQRKLGGVCGRAHTLRSGNPLDLHALMSLVCSR